MDFPNCIIGSIDLWSMADVPKRFADHGDDRSLAEGEFSRRLNVQGKSCSRSTKNRLTNLAPLLFCWCFTNYNPRLIAGRILP
jgi:hypothetical protein